MWANFAEGIDGTGNTPTIAVWVIVTQAFKVVSGSFTFILGVATEPVLVLYLFRTPLGSRTH